MSVPHTDGLSGIRTKRVVIVRDDSYPVAASRLLSVGTDGVDQLNRKPTSRSAGTTGTCSGQRAGIHTRDRSATCR